MTLTAVSGFDKLSRADSVVFFLILHVSLNHVVSQKQSHTYTYTLELPPTGYGKLYDIWALLVYCSFLLFAYHIQHFGQIIVSC